MRRLRPYFKYLRAVRGPLAIGIIFGLIYGAAGGGALPLILQHVFKRIFTTTEPRQSLAAIALIASGIPIVFLLSSLSGYLNSYFTQFAGVRVLEALRLDYFRKLQTLPLSFIQSNSSGDLLSRGLADTAQLQYALTQIANDGVKQPATLIAAIAVVAYMATRAEGVWLVLVCLAVVPLTVFPVRYVGRKVIKRAAQMQSQLGGVTGHLSESLAGAREVRAFGLEEHVTSRFAVACRALITSQMKIVKYAQALTPAIEFIAAVGIALTLVYSYRVHLHFDVFFGLIAALYKSYDPIKKLGALNSDLNRATASLDRLEVVLNEPLIITDPAQPVTIGRLKGDVQFDRVTFAYKTGEPVLHDINTTVPAGTVCALVGPSGAGKSTFANLVPRFYEVTGGRITIDGIDVRHLRLADLRGNIAVVSQDPVLFNDTIYNNLLLGRADATRDAVIAAARNAHADEFIRAFPEGYDTMVGERGALLSGGQKQRLAIARAFLRNAPILILDEATSALDSDSEAAVQDALRQLVVGKTVFIIAHRFSTIRDASMILVFERGQIVASGAHVELYAGNPLYRSLYDRQHPGS